jgi:hypothetical protein
MPRAMKMYGVVEIELYGGKWAASRAGEFTLGEGAPGTHWAGDWMGPRAGVDEVEKKMLAPTIQAVA